MSNENTSLPNTNNQGPFAWEAPVLYTEDWMNTLTGTNTTTVESGPNPDYLS